MKLNQNRPVDHRLSNVYRYSAGLIGAGLVVFGLVGVIALEGGPALFTTEGRVIAGLSTNAALGFLSVAFGSLLIGGAILGGAFASTLNIVIGVGFLLSGLVNLALLDTAYNLLAFRMSNVIFSFVVGVLLMTFGMYGRFSGGLPHDNPYWLARHPEGERAERPDEDLAGEEVHTSGAAPRRR
ncbi:DUF4383 domain-containing protein [Actinorugispora endophytica]|uniref:Uncharacterized protein DUF4383 n=1 Tax=Actinorugispora endophytica TaxID=1605990 RepID=A0A4R6UZE6_9ACTN|nr:DUF4383 domain-containing protein [Actinorugispora endophytica]TDQ52962.1 uncharacterized protein DUF4383 [Actinorugispora endophytica]